MYFICKVDFTIHPSDQNMLYKSWKVLIIFRHYLLAGAKNHDLPDSMRAHDDLPGGVKDHDLPGTVEHHDGEVGHPVIGEEDSDCMLITPLAMSTGKSLS